MEAGLRSYLIIGKNEVIVPLTVAFRKNQKYSVTSRRVIDRDLDSICIEWKRVTVPATLSTLSLLLRRHDCSYS